ncbi:MAG: BadF/BadG/BcrA/BcrD ATPase family protein, partial [Candidatus Tumulicola sp.]
GEAANPQVLGVARAADSIARSVTSVLDGETPSAIAVGAAGAGRPETAGALADALRERFPDARVAVTDDAHIALRGAIPAGDGIVLVVGTGSIAYGEIEGAQFRAGGAGYAFGDEGSAYAIGSAALKLLLRSFEGRTPRDPLLDALAIRTSAAGVHDVIAYVHAGGAPVATVAGVAPVVLDFANAGERSANKIVQSAALELFEMVRAVFRMAGAGATDLPVAFSGGLLRENSLLTYLVETRIAGELPYARVIKGGGAPHIGALADARALLS